MYASPQIQECQSNWLQGVKVNAADLCSSCLLPFLILCLPCSLVPDSAIIFAVRWFLFCKLTLISASSEYTMYVTAWVTLHSSWYKLNHPIHSASACCSCFNHASSLKWCSSDPWRFSKVAFGGFGFSTSLCAGASCEWALNRALHGKILFGGIKHLRKCNIPRTLKIRVNREPCNCWGGQDSFPGTFPLDCYPSSAFHMSDITLHRHITLKPWDTYACIWTWTTGLIRAREGLIELYLQSWGVWVP